MSLIVLSLGATVTLFYWGNTTPRPYLVIGCEDDFSRLKLRFGNVRTDKAPPHRITIIHGWPGVGKTTLVTSLAYDPEVTGENGIFPDGVFWAHLGEQGNPLAELAVWGRNQGVFDNIHYFLSSTTAAVSATGALKRANELNGGGNERLWRELGAVAARTTRPKSV